MFYLKTKRIIITIGIRVYLVIFIFKPKRLIFRSDLSLKLSEFGAKQLLSVRHPLIIILTEFYSWLHIPLQVEIEVTSSYFNYFNNLAFRSPVCPLSYHLDSSITEILYIFKSKF